MRQVELLGALDRHLLAGFDVGAEGLGMAFDGLGGNVETGQDVELFTALLERSFAAHQRHHAAHAGRAGGACDVEFAVTRALSPAACRAEVVGALETHLAHHGGELFGASIAVASLLTAGAGIRDGTVSEDDSNLLSSVVSARCMVPRTAVSTASRSRGSPRRWPRKMTPSSCVTSWATSWRMVSAVFFPGASGCLRRVADGKCFR